MLSRRRLLLALIALLLVPAAASRAADPDAGWTRFGKVDFNEQSKEKDVTAAILRGGWKLLKLKGVNADAKVDAITIIFTSGKDLALEFKDDLKAGAETRPLSLRGAGDRPIKKVRIKAHSLQ